MAEKPLDLERLKELVGEAPPADGEDAPVREIGRVRSRTSVEELAAAAVAEIEADVGPRRKYSTNERPPSVIYNRKGTSYYLLALAVLVAVIVGYRTLHRPPQVPSDPYDLVAALSRAAMARPALAPEWSAMRAVSDSLGERGLAVRIGALLVEFERASVNADSTAQRWGEDIAALLANEHDGAEVAALYAAGGEAARLPDARHALAPLVRAAPMAIGAWVQAARVAAAARDAGFFVSGGSRASLAALLAMPRVTPEVAAARDRLDKLLGRRGRPDFAAVADALELIQRELAN